MSTRAYLWQRSTAALLFALLVVHLAVIFYATTRHLTASDILARTRGSVSWAAFYAAFVLAAAVHASIGLNTVLVEWLPLGQRVARTFAAGFGVLLIVLGLRAVAAVVL